MAYVGIIPKEKIIEKEKKERIKNINNILDKIANDILKASSEGYTAIDIDYIGGKYKNEIIKKLKENKYEIDIDRYEDIITIIWE